MSAHAGVIRRLIRGYEAAAEIGLFDAEEKVECEALRAALADMERMEWLRQQCGPRGNLTIARDNGMELVAWSGDDPAGAIDKARQEGADRGNE